MNLEPVKIIKPCTDEEIGKRLDLYLSEKLPAFSSHTCTAGQEILQMNSQKFCHYLTI